MPVTLKTDVNDIQSLLSILGLGGLSRQAAQDDTGGGDFEASGGVATHPGFGGGGDGAVHRDVNYSEARANSDALGQPDDNLPPVDPSLGGAGDPTAQPRSLVSMLSGAQPAPAQESAPIPTNIASTHNPAAPPTKLLRLQQALGTAPLPTPVPQNFEGANIGDYQPPAPSVPDAGPITQRRSLADILSGAPAPTVAPPNTFSQNHPKLAKFLQAADEFALTAGPGIGAPTFGQGFEASLESTQRRKANALQNADIAAKTAHTQAETQAIQNPQGKPTASQLVFDKADNIIGYRDARGNLLGPKNPNLPQDVRDMIDAAEQRTHTPSTPEGQVMAYLVQKQGKTPAEAYQAIQNTKAENRPDTATQDKQRARQLENKLNAGTLTNDERDELTVRQQSEKLQGVPSEIISQVGHPPAPAQFAQGKKDPAYIAADKAWGQQVQALKEKEASATAGARGQAYGEFKPVQVIDPASGELRWTFAKDAISSGAAPVAGGVKAMSQQQQFKEMQFASSKARDAINGLDRDFTAPQIAKLTLAFSHNDPGVVSNEVSTILGTQELTPKQEDFVVWLQQLNERALSLRNVAGMGQGSQDLRSAIQATLPSVRSGGKAMALKQLDAFDNQVSLLQQGIPKVRGANGGNQGGSNNNSLAGPVKDGEPTATGPGGHTIVFRSSKWVDPTNGTEVK